MNNTPVVKETTKLFLERKYRRGVYIAFVNARIKELSNEIVNLTMQKATGTAQVP